MYIYIYIYTYTSIYLYIYIYIYVYMRGSRPPGAGGAGRAPSLHPSIPPCSLPPSFSNCRTHSRSVMWPRPVCARWRQPFASFMRQPCNRNCGLLPRLHSAARNRRLPPRAFCLLQNCGPLRARLLLDHPRLRPLSCDHPQLRTST